MGTNMSHLRYRFDLMLSPEGTSSVTYARDCHHRWMDRFAAFSCMPRHNMSLESFEHIFEHVYSHPLPW